MVAQFARSESGEILEEYRKHTYRLVPSLTYAMTEDLDVLLGYSFTRIEDLVNKTDENRNTVYMEFTYAAF